MSLYTTVTIIFLPPQLHYIIVTSHWLLMANWRPETDMEQSKTIVYYNQMLLFQILINVQNNELCGGGGGDDGKSKILLSLFYNK